MQAALRDVPLKAGRLQGFTNFRKASSNLSGDRRVLQQPIVTRNNCLHVARKGQVCNDTFLFEIPTGHIFIYFYICCSLVSFLLVRNTRERKRQK